MYIRETITNNKKNNSTYVKHQLVESYRSDKGPRQRVIMELGTLALDKTDKRKLTAILEARLAGQLSLFEDKDPIIAKIADEAMKHYNFIQTTVEQKVQREEERELVSVDLNSLATSQHRSLGPELVAHTFWQRLGFDHILQECGFSSKEKALAQAVIVGRLIAPSSDLATWEWLRNRTALLEMLPFDVSKVGKDAVYELADKLLLHKSWIEQALRDKEAFLFPAQTNIFLYDLTNTYFEGSCSNNDLAQRGHSKEKRSDCHLVTLDLVVDERGFPILSRIYSGNQSEPKTLEEILEHLYMSEDRDQVQLFQGIRPTIVMDRGIATKDNIDLLKSKDYPYLVVERRAVEKDYILEFEQARETFTTISREEKQGKVYVKKIPREEGTRVLCLSEGREEKERAIDKLKEERYLHDLKRLEVSVSKGNIQLVAKVAERVGRLKERYPSIAPHYAIDLILSEDKKKVMAVTHVKQESRIKRQILTGCYVIETSHKDLEASEIWRLYTTLTRVEDAFRSLKTDLGIRPVYHHIKRRTEGHLFISVLAYHLLNCIEKTLAVENDRRSWATIRKVLSTHQRCTVIFTDDQDQIHHIRVSGTPESVHKEVYQKLNVKDSLKSKRDIFAQRL